MPTRPYKHQRQRKNDSEVPAKKSKVEPTVTIPTQMLMQMRSSLSEVVSTLMQMSTTEVDKRYWLINTVDSLRKAIDEPLGIERKKFGALMGNENMEDIFKCLDRATLDNMLLVNARFGTIVLQRMTQCCLRILGSAKLTKAKAATRGGRRKYSAVFTTTSSRRTIPTNTFDETEALAVLLNACRSSSLAVLCLKASLKSKPIQAACLDQIRRFASTFRVMDVNLSGRQIASDIPEGLYSQTVAALQGVYQLTLRPSAQYADENARIVRHCVESGIELSFRSDDCQLTDDHLLGLLDAFDHDDGSSSDNCRRPSQLSLRSSKITENCLKRLIERAEVIGRPRCRLHVFYDKSQCEAGLDKYRQLVHGTRYGIFFRGISGQWMAGIDHTFSNFTISRAPCY